HLDGARLFNAMVATGTTLEAMCQPFDSVSLCFSKGLGAPIGSALVGSHAFIDKARRWRKVVGGGMRQAGIIAAACQYALEHHVADLEKDHRRAARLGEGLSALPGITVTSQATNMVFAEVEHAHVAPLAAWLKEHDILLDLVYATRFVVHRDIDDADIERVIEVMQAYFKR
ncbi:low specificity L-threonine aldolase, partial [Halomonas sp. 707D4]